MEQKRVRIEPGIFRTPNKEYPYVVEISRRVGKGARAKRLFRQGNAKNLVAARKLKQKLCFELNEVEKRGIGPSFADFVVEEYHQYLEGRRRASTFYRQWSAIKAHFLPHLGSLFLSQIGAREIDQLIERVTEGRSSQTKKHLINYMNDIFKYALKKGYVGLNPCEQIERPRVRRKDPHVLSEAQARTLLLYLRKSFPVVFYHVALAIHTLCRAGELRALTWADVDFETRQININKTCDTKSKSIKQRTKNSENRKIPINDELLQILSKLKQDTFTAPSDPVLPHWREFAAGEQSKVVRTICVQLGLPPIRFHDLRATGITILILKNVSLGKVQLVAGHRRITSLLHYLRLSGRDAASATDSLAFLTTDPSDSAEHINTAGNESKLLEAMEEK